MNDLVHADAMLAIAIMAVITAALRLGGFFLMSYIPVTPPIQRMLNALPGSVIAAAVLPVAAEGGPVAIASVLTAMAAMHFLRSDIVAVISGVGMAALLRATGIGV